MSRDRIEARQAQITFPGVWFATAYKVAKLISFSCAPRQICDVDASGEIDRDEFFTLLRFLHVEVRSHMKKCAHLNRACDLISPADPADAPVSPTARKRGNRRGRSAAHRRAGKNSNACAPKAKLNDSLRTSQLLEMADIIVKKLDIDGNGQISLDELMAWFDQHPDSDVTDLFTLLNEVRARSFSCVCVWR